MATATLTIALLVAALLAAAPARAFDLLTETQNFSKTTERELQITKTLDFQTLLAQKEIENNLENAEIQLTDPERLPYGNVCWNRNRECAGDVRFYDWEEAGFGKTDPVLFGARSGATLSAKVWATKKGPKRRPGVVITTGSVQAPETLYWGTAANLAKHGYVVLTYDVQGQGRSDTFGEGADLLEGVPSQAGQPFYDGTEDALDFLLSKPENPYAPRPSCSSGTDHSAKHDRRVGDGLNAAFNPFWKMVDPKRIAIAGHSLGAGGVSYVGQLDDRVDAIAAWDNLRAPSPGSGCPSGSSPRPEQVEITKPAIGFSNDYGITPTPNLSDPDPQRANNGFLDYVDAGVDTMQINKRGGTHEEYAFIPGQTVPLLGLASFRGMDMANWYTIAWFDRYVKCQRMGGKSRGKRRAKLCQKDAQRRLLSDRWRDDSAEGRVDPNGDSNSFSFYLRSRYDIGTVGGRRAVCDDLREGCKQMRPDGLPPDYFQVEDAYTAPERRRR